MNNMTRESILNNLKITKGYYKAKVSLGNSMDQRTKAYKDALNELHEEHRVATEALGAFYDKCEEISPDHKMYAHDVYEIAIRILCGEALEDYQNIWSITREEYSEMMDSDDITKECSEYLYRNFKRCDNFINDKFSVQTVASECNECGCTHNVKSFKVGIMSIRMCENCFAELTKRMF